MIYQARFAHLEHTNSLEVGETVERGHVIGRMGNSGKSAAPHVHFDLIQEVVNDKVYRLKDIEGYTKNHAALLGQYHYFLDHELFDYPLKVTSCFGDPSYLNGGFWEYHPAYDIVPLDRHETTKHFDLHWNRTSHGKVVAVGEDYGYGNYICIAYQGA